MYVASFVSVFDRAALPPLLVIIALSLGSPLEQVGYTLMVYSLCYAAFQLVWGYISDRWGRINVLRISTAVGALGCLLAALAPDITVLGIARAMSGAAFAATVPGALTYFGDSLRQKDRLSANANLATVTSLGTAIGTFGAAAIAEFTTWRVVFVVIGLVSVGLVLSLLRSPDLSPRAPRPLMKSIRMVLSNRWVVLILALVFLEGFAIVGILGYLPASAQHHGSSLLVAGLVTATYGLAVVFGGQAVKPLSRLVPTWLLILVGGLLGAVAYSVMAVVGSAIGVLVGSVLLGLAWASAHPSMQTWVTDAATAARATGTALFAMSLFAGGSLGAVVGAQFAGSGQYTWLFVISAGVCLLFGIVASIFRSRYALNDD